MPWLLVLQHCCQAGDRYVHIPGHHARHDRTCTVHHCTTLYHVRISAETGRWPAAQPSIKAVHRSRCSCSIQTPRRPSQSMRFYFLVCWRLAHRCEAPALPLLVAAIASPPQLGPTSYGSYGAAFDGCDDDIDRIAYGIEDSALSRLPAFSMFACANIWSVDKPPHHLHLFTQLPQTMQPAPLLLEAWPGMLPHWLPDAHGSHKLSPSA